MKEPEFRRANGRGIVPLSQATVEELRQAVSGVNVSWPDYEDADFERRYDAILLKERGF